jgi:hypothetical protein
VPDCRALAEAVASWGGSVVPARVNMGPDGWHKGSIKGWPQRASADPSAWPDGWFTWGGDWWVALVPKVGRLLAVDLDGEEAVDLYRQAAKGDRSLWEPGSLSYTTPGHGGGMHFVWRWPAHLPTFSRRVVTTASGAQIDLRGEATFTLLCGAPRPDLPPGAGYGVVSRPGVGGPPPLPAGFVPWTESLGDLNVEASPSLGARQLSPEGLAELAARQGGRVHADRHVTLFRLASWLRVRRGTRTFETLAAELWRLCETYVDFGDEGEEAWQQEILRVAHNASRYTEERDRMQTEAAAALAESWAPKTRRR